MKAIVVGAGLAGLSAAYTLKQAGWQVKVIESADHVGGRANTVAKNGYLIDTAASAMSSSYTSYLALAQKVGVLDQVAPASPYTGLVRDDRVHELDMRHIQWSGLTTGLLSLRAKLGLLKLFRDVFGAKRKGMLNYADLAKAAPIDTETSAQYVLREFSQEINDYFCDPMVRVMMLANSDIVSKVELYSGIANILDTDICSMRGGQQRFPKLLAEGLDISFNSTATGVSDADGRVDVSWQSADGDQRESADVCIVACYLNTATDICSGYRYLLEPLNNILRYTRALSVSIGASVQPDCRAMTVLVPTREEPNIAALFLEHNKCEDRAPAGHSLFTAYHEASASEALWPSSDEEIIGRTQRYIERLFPAIRGKIDMTHVQRWNTALPLMKVGGYREVARLNQQMNAAARVQFAGDYLSGAGQNTAVDFGVKAANNVIANNRLQ